jgi:hypothetical protein
MTDTCSAIPELRAEAEAIVASTPPAAANPGDWSANAKRLGDAVTALDAPCKANDAAAFEHAFSLVHEHFHGLIGALGNTEHDGATGSAAHDHAEHHH